MPVALPVGRYLPVPAHRAHLRRRQVTSTGSMHRAIAALAVIGPIANRRDPGEVLTLDKLLEHGAVALGGRRHRQVNDLAGGRIGQQMHLHPRPAALDAMLAGVPFPVTRHFETGGVDQQTGVLAGPKGWEPRCQPGLALAQEGVVGDPLGVEAAGLEDGACRAFQHPVGQAQRDPPHQEGFNEDIGVALRPAPAGLTDRRFQHLGIEQESEGQGAATLMLPVESRPVAALGLGSYFGGHA